MSNEEFVRRPYEIAGVKDIPGWIACFNPDGVFVRRIQLFDCYSSGTVILGQLGVLGNPGAVLEPEAAQSA